MSTSRSRGKGGFLLVIVAFLLLGLLAMPVLQASPQYIPSQHADAKHGAGEANFVRRKCDENGPYQTWREKRDTSEFIEICKLGDGKWGYRPFRLLSDGMREEKSAFIYSNHDGSLSALLRELSTHATRYTKPLP